MIIPYDFYYSDSNDNKNLDKVYHNGQMRIWDGKEVLTDLFAKYENTEIDADKKESLTNILSVILWGEYIEIISVAGLITHQVLSLRPCCLCSKKYQKLIASQRNY